MTQGWEIEPPHVPFEIEIKPLPRAPRKSPKTGKIIRKTPVLPLPNRDQIRVLIEGENLTILHAAKRLGTSCTTLRKLCRTHKIGFYSEKPEGLVPTSSQVPFGWKVKCGRWVVYFQEWKWVEKIFEMRNLGMSFHKIAYELSEKKVQTKNGGVWSAKTVSQVIVFNQIHYERILDKKLGNPGLENG